MFRCLWAVKPNILNELYSSAKQDIALVPDCAREKG